MPISMAWDQRVNTAFGSERWLPVVLILQPNQTLKFALRLAHESWQALRLKYGCLKNAMHLPLLVIGLLAPLFLPLPAILLAAVARLI
jgi:hypothetical protein